MNEPKPRQPVLSAEDSKKNMSQVRDKTGFPKSAQRPVPPSSSTPMPTEGRYRKKPVVIRAFRLLIGCSYPNWFLEAMNAERAVVNRGNEPSNGKKTLYAEVTTLEGVMRADDGDWIVCGVNAEIYPCKDDVFKKSYDFAGTGGE